MRLFFAVFAGILLFVVGCEDPEYTALRKQREFTERTFYYKDERVGICFAYIACTSNDDAKVPCRGWGPLASCEPVKALLPGAKANSAAETRPADVNKSSFLGSVLADPHSVRTLLILGCLAFAGCIVFYLERRERLRPKSGKRA